MEQNINATDFANSPALWALAALVVTVVVIHVILFLRLAYGASKQGLVNVDKKQCNRALRAGMVTAMGPAFGVFIVMIGLIAIFGGPISWLRLSVIGSAGTELMAARIGIGAAGGDITQVLTASDLSTALFTMTVNSFGWLLVVLIFASRIETLRTKLGGGDSRWMGIFSSAATLGIFGAFNSNFIVTSLQAVETDYGTLAALAGGAIGMAIFLMISQKKKWLKEYCLGLSMIVGLTAAIIVTS